jgi:HD superfamily phosphohydrolase
MCKQLFHTRYALHKRAYQHRVSASIELMLIEVLVLADPHILLPGKNGNLCRMSQCPSDMTAYWRLGEYVVRQIENSYCQVKIDLLFMKQPCNIV